MTGSHYTPIYHDANGIPHMKPPLQWPKVSTLAPPRGGGIRNRAHLAFHEDTTPTTLTTTQEVQDKIKGSQVVLCGDNHIDQGSHEVFASLMPTFKKAGISLIGLELPESWNKEFIPNLQRDIKEQNLDVVAVGKEISDQLIANGYGDFAKATQVVDDFANIFVESTANDMKIVGLDVRWDSMAERKTFEMIAGKFDPDKLDKTLIEDIRGMNDYILVGKDGSIADNVVAALQPNQKMAIMFGVAHSCDGEKRPHLINELRERGVATTRINLEQTGKFVENACIKPPPIRYHPTTMH